MQLEDAIEHWRAAHGAGLSKSTRQDIAGILTAVGSCELDELDVSDLGAPERDAIVRTARATTTLNATAINQFLTIVVEWAAENEPSAEVEMDADEDLDEETSTPTSEEDLDDDELHLIDDDLRDLLEDEGQSDPDDVDDVGDLEDLADSRGDDRLLVDDDLDDLDDASGSLDATSLDGDQTARPLSGDADATLVYDADDIDAAVDEYDIAGDDADDAASSFFETIGQSTPGAAPAAASVFGDLTTAAPTAPVEQVSVGSSGIFSEAAAEVPEGRSIDWITAGYFAIALICFAFVIYLYFTG